MNLNETLVDIVRSQVKRRPDLIAQVETSILFMNKKYPLVIDVYGEKGEGGIQDIRFESGGEDISLVLSETLMDDIATDILQGHYE